MYPSITTIALSLLSLVQLYYYIPSNNLLYYLDHGHLLGQFVS